MRLSLTLLASSLLIAGCDSEPSAPAQQQQQLSEPKQALIGTLDTSEAGAPLPGLVFTDSSGKELDLATLKGRPVLINLWATWCAPCVVEMPRLDELAAVMGGELKVLTVSQDLSGAEAVEPFFAKNRFTHLEPWLDPENSASAAFDVDILPVTVLFDANGREIFRVRGDYDWSSEMAIAAIRENAIARNSPN